MNWCCIYKRPYARTGPWTCPACGLICGFPCEPEPVADGSPRDMAMALQMAEARDLLSPDGRWQWLQMVQDGLVDMFSDWSTQ